ncbi:MAG: hypothetical protein AB8G95_29210 [Anaerolineae bacterium]
MRKVFLRIWGLLIILKTLLPVIWILFIVCGGYYFYSTTREALETVSTYTQNLEEKHFGPIRSEIAKVQEDLDNVSSDLSALSQKVQEIGKIDMPKVDMPEFGLPTGFKTFTVKLGFGEVKIPNGLKTTNISIPDIDFPPLSIPGLDIVGEEMAALFCGNDGCHFNELKTSLNTVQASFQGFIDETQIVTAEITGILQTIMLMLKILFWLFLITVLIVIPSFIIRYIQRFWTNLQTGWGYLSGQETSFALN